MTGTLTATVPFATVGEVRAMIARFENGSLTRKQWDHRAHLTVAAWYLLRYEEATAIDKVITGILHFNRVNRIERTRTSGYHETLTLFWLAIVGRFLSSLERDLPVLEKINRLVDAYQGRPRLILDYYSPECLWSWDARLHWVEPDLRPL